MLFLILVWYIAKKKTLIPAKNFCQQGVLCYAVLATDKYFNEKGTTQIFKNLELSLLVELRGELSNSFLTDLELLAHIST